MLVRLLFKLKRLFAIVAISKVMTVPGFGQFFLLIKKANPFYFRIFGVYPGLPLMIFRLEAVGRIKNL